MKIIKTKKKKMIRGNKHKTNKAKNGFSVLI